MRTYNVNLCIETVERNEFLVDIRVDATCTGEAIDKAEQILKTALRDDCTVSVNGCNKE